MRKKQQSISRQIKRGHTIGVLNSLTVFLELYRRTTTSRKHTVFISQISLNRFNGDGNK